MARISEQTIQQIIDTSDIVEVISSRVELKKRGINFWALCPFHSEKTPSFSVSPTKQIYTCFGGCGAKGGAINFLMEYDKLNFYDAITKLAQMYSIEIEIDEQAKQKQNVKSQLLEIYSIASIYYHTQLDDIKSEKYLNYLKSRNINDEMISIFNIGCSNKNTSPKLLDVLREKKFSAEAMKKAGLFINTKNGYVETFNSRVIFPIKNPNGEVIAFAGRVLEKNPKLRKFINSYDSPIYYKSKNFYGLDITKDYIQKEKSVFLVEGQWDVVRLYQNNIKNVVGIGGTSLTDLQASLIKLYTSNIFILLDGDEAGVKAAIRSGYTLLKNSINAKIICPPNNYDPDDWLNTNDGLQELLSAKEDAEFVISFHYKSYDKTSNNAINDFIEEVIDNIIEIKDPIFRELSAKNLSDVVNISEENVIQTINNKLSKKSNRKKLNDKPELSQPSNKNKIILIEDDLIRLCLSNEFEVRQIIFQNMDTNWLNSSEHLDIYNKVYIHMNSNYDIPIDLIINTTEEKNIRSKIIELSKNIEKFNPNIKMAVDCLIRFEERFLKKEIKNLREQIKTVSTEEIHPIIQKISIIDKKVGELKNKYK